MKSHEHTDPNATSSNGMWAGNPEKEIAYETAIDNLRSSCCNAKVDICTKDGTQNYIQYPCLQCLQCGKPCDTKMNKEYTIGWEQKCTGCGHHDSMWKSLTTSPQWKKWREHALKKMLYDIYECEELGIMSAQHFKDFIEYCKTI